MRGACRPRRKQASLAGYETALRQLHGYRGDPVATIDGVLAADRFRHGPRSARGGDGDHVGKEHAGRDRATLLTLRDLGNRANDRERAWTAALAAWFAGDWEGMRQRLDRLLVDHLRDALALQVGRPTSTSATARICAAASPALPAWSRETPGYGFVLGMQAFGHEECGDYGAAEAHGRHALEIEPDDGWAHHAVTHVMEMQARQAEGAAWMESRVSHWAQPGQRRSTTGGMRRCVLTSIRMSNGCWRSPIPRSARATASPAGNGRRGVAPLADAPPRHRRRRSLAEHRRCLRADGRARLLCLQRHARDDGLRRQRPQHRRRPYARGGRAGGGRRDHPTAA